MIKLRKKIIRLRKKKNPGWEVEEDEKPKDYIPRRTVSIRLINHIKEVFGFNEEWLGYSFSQLLALWNQGSHCFDCPNPNDPKPSVYYPWCLCEECEECDENYCTCPLETDEDIYKTTWEFAKLVLSGAQLAKLTNWSATTRRQAIADTSSRARYDIVYSQDIHKPSYPKYKKIAEELFRL